MGSAAAYALSLRGKRVLGLEQFSPAHALGSSHGESRIIRQAYFEDPAYVPLVLRAYELWEGLEREAGDDLLSLTGGLMLGSESGELVARSVRSARSHDLPHEVLDHRELRRRFPALAPAPHTVALYERRAGFVRPERSVMAHLSRASELGADLRFEEPVTRWEAAPSGDRVEVEPPKGTYEAERLVICAGAWAPELLTDLGLPLEVERQVMYWFEPGGGVEPFLPERFPIFIWEPDDGNMFYAFPAVDGGETVKAAFYRAGGVPCTPRTIDREVREGEISRLRGYLSEHVPALAGRCVDARACMYTNTPDLDFVLAPHPEFEAVAVAAGFSGHGYKFCTVVGEILADLATEGSTEHPIGLFSPARFAPEPRDAATGNVRDATGG
ncbi:N-methyl-L-tryptophan oxidase [Rubrobacter marinus]|uniref:N-methyl-L-tryptophan oxidase n=1 Tax=Rubrobacter marinus TaxID=2653852 RepID=A0A6G8Q2L7_9ACTN|nr:N-methyl-L-tryptophan oxidase [Rubrobacter marinus]